MTNLSRPTPQQLFNKIRNNFRANVLGGSDIIPESNEHYVVANDYAMAEEFYAIAEQQFNEMRPEDACCENLVTMAARRGVYPNPGEYAQGFICINGVAGAQLNPSLTLSTAAGQFVTVSTLPNVLPASGAVVSRIRALESGVPTTRNVTTGVLATALTDVDSTVQIIGGGIYGGAEPEDCEQFRTRYLDRLANAPRATSEWLRDEIAKWPGVTRVCTRAGACGEPSSPCSCPGTCSFNYYAMFDGSFDGGAAPQNLLDEINNYVFGTPQGHGLGIAEIGICGNVYRFEPVQVDITCDFGNCQAGDISTGITGALTEYFQTLCPSEPLTIRNIELVLADLLGLDTTFAITLTSADTVNVTQDADTGDLIPNCDYGFFLGTVSITGTGTAGENCT